MPDKDQQRMDARMNNFKLKPSDSVWIGIEQELRKDKRRPAAWWWAGLLLLPLVLFIIYLQPNTKENSLSKSAAKEMTAADEFNDKPLIGARNQENQPNLGGIKNAEQLSGIKKGDNAPLQIEENENAAKQSSAPLAIQSTPQRGPENASSQSQASKPIPYKDLKTSRKVVMEKAVVTDKVEEDFLARNIFSYDPFRKSLIEIQRISINQLLSGTTSPGTEIAAIKTYKDIKSGGIKSPKKKANTLANKWKFGLHTVAFVMNQGSFLDGFDLNKNLRDAYSAPVTSPGQSFTQEQTVLNSAKRLGIGAVAHYGVTNTIGLFSGIELQRRFYDITQSTFLGGLPNSGNYSSIETSRSEIKDNQWAVEIPIGIGLQFGKRFNLSLQLNNAYLFKGVDSLRTFASGNNLDGYQPALGITPQLLLGKKSNWSIGLPLETGLKKSASGQFNNAVGLRLGYFPQKNPVK